MRSRTTTPSRHVLALALAWALIPPLAVAAGGAPSPAPRPRWSEAGAALTDHRQGLQWARTDNGADISQPEALAWCQQQGQGWRLPSRAELEGLYASGAAGETTPCRGAQCKVPKAFSLSSYFFWSGQVDAASGQAWFLYLHTGHPTLSPIDYRLNARALCVRAAP